MVERDGEGKRGRARVGEDDDDEACGASPGVAGGDDTCRCREGGPPARFDSDEVAAMGVEVAVGSQEIAGANC